MQEFIGSQIIDTKIFNLQGRKTMDVSTFWLGKPHCHAIAGSLAAAKYQPFAPGLPPSRFRNRKGFKNILTLLSPISIEKLE